jgi:ABC-2 type transport system permease protein
VTAPAWLIAEREFRAYTTTTSFWIALAIGPLFMAGALALAGLASGPPPPISVAVRATDPALAQSATAALGEAARIEGRRYAWAGRSTTSASLVVARSANGGIEARFSSGFPLSATGRTLIGRSIERDVALSRLAEVKGGAQPTRVLATIDAAPRSADAGALSRFGLVMILWLTLTGSLGMLLQAVVRERANRALEGLLAAARPWEIVAGKLAGVGAVSAMVLVAWLGSAGALSVLAPGGAGLFQAVIGGLAAPAMLAKAAALYVLAFGFYGLITVAVGAAARDSASAQNLSRPMFAVLLAAFFAALAAVSGAAGKLAWLVYVPPFTPFMLLLEPPGALPAHEQFAAIGLLLAATVVAGRLAVGRLTLSGASERPLPAPNG